MGLRHLRHGRELLAVACISAFAAALTAQTAPSPRLAFTDELAAHAIYDNMIAAMRSAKTLHWRSDCNGYGDKGGHWLNSYEIWLKKPNFFRMEVFDVQAKSQGGVLVGDGNYLWIYWPGGRPMFWPSNEDEQTYKKTRDISYMKKPAPPGRHSIGHEACYLGSMCMPILDPSIFHGYSDSLQPYIDGIRALPAEKAGGEECDVIEVSFMKGQRSWQLWIAKSDRLPRRLKQVVHVNYDIFFQEDWSSVTVNGDISDDKFVWKPPEGWQEWRPATPEEVLLKPGTPAPDFEMLAIDGKSVKLSQYRNQVVWLYIWRGG